MTLAIGIDLGTTNSVISRLVDGRPVPIEIDGSAIVPSVVLYLPDRTVVGREARNLELQYPERTVRSAKRRMGTAQAYEIDGKHKPPEEVSAEVLRALRDGASEALGQPVRQVVITVPAYFDDAQRRATLKAGELAGLEVLRLLNEPTSASLVYDQVASDSPAEGPENVLIYDLGGGTFDVSVLEVFEGVREVRSTAGNTHLGGDDFDEMLVRVFLDELRTREQVDLRDDARAMARLRRVAEEAKIKLSSDTETDVREEFLASHEGRPIHLEMHLTRRRFEALIEPLLASTIGLAKKAIEDAGLSADDLSRVCLVGGSTRIPMVRRLLSEAFEADIHEEIDPDLAVALGAAVQAGLLLDVPVDRILVDVASHSLGILVVGQRDRDTLTRPDTFAPIIQRNTVLPATKAEEFYTAVEDQKKVEVNVYQGESTRASSNTHVGDFTFELDPAPIHSPVRVEFSYDLNGVIQVTMSQIGSKRTKTVSMSVARSTVKPGQPRLLSGPMSAIEKKAVEMLEQLDDDAREELSSLLDDYRSSSGDARQEAEDALLDFFAELDEGEGSLH